MAHITNTKVKSGNVLVLSGSSVEISGALKTTSTVTAGGNFVGNLTGNADTVTNGVYTTTIATVATTAVTAGSGLTGGGTVGSLTLNVGAGDGITVAADSVAVDNTVVRTSTIASNATTGVTAGNGLTGGGTVGVVTLNVGAGTGITVAADSVGIDTSAVVTITGSQTISGAKTFSAATTTFAAVTGTQAQFTAITGTLVGNASTATSAATWTTARTLTVGSTGKSVNGSADVSWTLAEIGAVGASSNNTFTGTTTFNGAVYFSVTSTATAYTVTSTDNIIFASAGPYTITVPSAAANTGRKLVFKKSDAGEATITLSASVGTIDGGTFELNGPYQSVTLVSNGSNWFVL